MAENLYKRGQKRSHTGSNVVAYGSLSVVNEDFFSITIGRQEDAKKNAEVMQRLLEVYLQVCS